MTEQFEREVIDRLARIEETVSNMKALENRMSEVEKWVSMESGKQSVRYAFCSMSSAVIGAIVSGVGVSVLMYLLGMN